MKKFFLLFLLTGIQLLMSFEMNQTKKTGVDQFLSNPNNYTFKCGCDLGEVLSATLEKDGNMVIKYYYMCGGKKLHGALEGKYNRAKNKFEGTYNTENKMFYGQINFSYNEMGEGTGHWDNGVGTVSMLIK